MSVATPNGILAVITAYIVSIFRFTNLMNSMRDSEPTLSRTCAEPD